MLHWFKRAKFGSSVYDLNAVTPDEYLKVNAGGTAIESGTPAGSTVIPGWSGGRLTLDASNTNSPTDQDNATTLRLDPHAGDQIAVYDGSAWQWIDLGSGLTITNAGLSVDTNYDVFLDYNGGSAQLQLTAWTNDTTRATALVRQDGVFVKTGDTDHLFVGTIRTVDDASTAKFQDSEDQRYVWNAYNRVPRPLIADQYSTASWTYATTAWRAANANTTFGQTRVGAVIGINQQVKIYVSTMCFLNSGSGSGVVGVGVDSTTTDSSNTRSGAYQADQDHNKAVFANYCDYPGVGYHYFQWIENRSAGTGTMTFYGTLHNVEAGICGELMC